MGYAHDGVDQLVAPPKNVRSPHGEIVATYFPVSHTLRLLDGRTGLVGPANVVAIEPDIQAVLDLHTLVLKPVRTFPNARRRRPAITTHFHLHVDAEWVSRRFEAFLSERLGFRRTDFVGVDGTLPEPRNHLTLKLSDVARFRDVFAEVVRRAQADRGMLGYVEGEFIALDREIATKPYADDVPLPFQLSMEPLPQGRFRESEIHITLCAERSDARLLRNLATMGFLTIYKPKPRGLAVIFTAQGTRRLIAELAKRTISYLDAAGGAEECSIKEERIAKWWVTDGQTKIPPVVYEVAWLPSQ